MNIKLLVTMLSAMVLGLANIQAFTVTAHPAARTVTEGEKVSFFIETDSTDLSYYWQFAPAGVSWTNITGATDSTYTLAQTALTDSGFYRCVATNGTISYNSNPAELKVNMAPPRITVGPDPQIVTEGETAAFTVTASGADISYQWQKDSADVAGAEDAAYTTPATTMADSGAEFYCIASNAAGDDTSAAALLTVNEYIPFAEWLYSADITIGTTPDWADVANTVTDFPMLVRFDSLSFDFSLAQAGGEDIRFSKIDGETLLPHEIEYWDAVEGKAVIWVLMDTVVGDAMQSIKMHWGNLNAPDGSDGAAVFGPANGFAGVWHLDEDGNNDSAGYADATGNENQCKGTSMTADSDVPGIIGMGQNFDGEEDFLDCGADTTLNLTDSITVCAWINTFRLGRHWVGIVNKDRGDEKGYWLLYSGKADQIVFESFTDDWTKAIMPFTNKDADQWHYVCGTFDNTEFNIYRDGDSISSASYAGSLTPSASSLRIGDAREVTRFFAGIIDEVQISKVARSSDWIKLAYENQKSAQTLVSLPIAEGCVAEFSVADDTVKTVEGGSYTITGSVKCALKYNWTRVDNGTESPAASKGMTVKGKIGRITSDTTYTYRFNALFDTGWASTEVVVEIIENIPDPVFNLTSPFTGADKWDGIDSIIIQPFVTNLGPILSLPSPYNTIKYKWNTSRVAVLAIKTDNKLTLRKSYGDGTLNVELCADNGGTVVCKDIDIEVERPVGIIDKKNALLIPVEMRGSYLIWNRHARVKIWSIDGKLVFDKIGHKGSALVLPSSIQRILTGHSDLVKIISLD